MGEGSGDSQDRDWNRLIDMARLADPDPLRERLRDAVTEGGDGGEGPVAPPSFPRKRSARIIAVGRQAASANPG